MPIPKRYFHVSQEINHDPELWVFTDRFGDRTLRTWLQILVYLERSENCWRITEGTYESLGRMVRQYAKSIRRQVEAMISCGWLLVLESDKNGSPLVLGARNWSLYNRRREHKEASSVPPIGADRVSLPPFPSPTPSLSIPTPKIKKEELIKSSASVVPTKRTREDVTSSKTSETWGAYASAYRKRYGADPVRNAKVNGILARLVERLGTEEAPQVTAFYLAHNKPFYVSARHSTDLLLRDAEGLRTEWITGNKVTTLETRTAEQRDSVNEQVKRVRAMMNQGGA